MINTYTGTAKQLLDEAYARLGLPPTHPITEAIVSREREELELYDYIVSPNPGVEQSLVHAGVSPSRILRSSYGWSPASFVSTGDKAIRSGFRALFIGSIGVRKGIPQLLDAWKKSGVKGELLLVGSVEPAMEPILAPYLDGYGVRLAGFDFFLGRFYKSADIFILPSIEEGDPLVTYEAAGCGLPVVATPMGAANIIKHDVNGLLVQPYDVDALAQAIARLANSSDLKNRLAQQAAKDAQNFTVEKVGKERAVILRKALDVCA